MASAGATEQVVRKPEASYGDWPTLEMVPAEHRGKEVQAAETRGGRAQGGGGRQRRTPSGREEPRMRQVKKVKQGTARRRAADYGVESAAGWATTRWRAERGQKEQRTGWGSTAEEGAATATDEPAGGASFEKPRVQSPLAGEVELE